MPHERRKPACGSIWPAKRPIKERGANPNYALAYAGLASSISRLWGMHNVPTDADELLAITEKALALDLNLAEAHAARGEALANSSRRAEAAAAFERALELDPNSFDASLSYATSIRCATSRAIRCWSKPSATARRSRPPNI